MGDSLKPTFLGSALCLFLLLITAGLGQLEQARFDENLHTRVTDRLSHLRARLESEINANLHLTRSLVGLIVTHPDLSQEEFQNVAQELTRGHSHLRNIGLAPGNVIRYLYPLEGNERALGLAYHENPKQWPAVARAIQSKQTVVAGPVELVQGGRAFISRTPVWTAPIEKGTDERSYWGIISMVIGMDSLFQSVGLSTAESDMELALRGADGLGTQGGMIYGEASLFNHAPVLMAVKLPSGEWQLGATPKGGWAQASPYLYWIWAIGILLAISVGLLAYTWLTNQIRSRQQLELATQTAESANRAKSDFLATMSHEIRTPMNAIIGISDLMQSEIDDPEQQEHLQLLQKSSNTLLELINSILDLSKIESGELTIAAEEYSPGLVLRDTLEILRGLANQKGLVLELELRPGVPQVAVGDSQRIRQILLNLIGNAIKFTEQGKITCSLALDPEQPNTLHYAIQDTGIGIEPNQLEQIFNKFTQIESGLNRSYGGSGLGLTIARSLAELLGGSLKVASAPGHGSTFSFTLPYQPAPVDLEPTALDEPTESMTVRPEQLRILLAEDNPINQTLIRHFLKGGPHHLEVADNGEQAVSRLKKDAFDLVLMDIQMPVMDGYTAARTIRAWEAESGRSPTPIIALTAHALNEDRQKSLAAGCNHHLNKPITRAQLLTAIEAATSRL